MRVVFRVDASTITGMGHVMRCVTLAGALRKHVAEIVFICRPQPGDSINWIRERGFTVLELSSSTSATPSDCLLRGDAEDTMRLLADGAPIDWLVADHYGVDHRWESVLRSVVRRILVIDDLANRKHDCDLLLDQNFYCDGAHRYDGLLPSHCQVCLGPAYVMLRDEFYELKKRVRRRDGSIRHVLCFYGASDPTGETLKAVMALQAPGMEALTVDVVVGAANPQRESIAALCEKLSNFTFHCQTNRMAELCARADLALGAGGSANWERAFLGLPSLVTITADNQAETTRAMASRGGVWLLGEAASVTDAGIVILLREAMASRARLEYISRTALSIMGSGDIHGPQALIKVMLN